MKTKRSGVISRIVGTVSLCTMMVLGVAPAPATSLAKPRSPWVKVGGAMEIDVPTGFGSLADIDPQRMGVQVLATLFRNATAGRVRFASNTTILGEAADGGFTPRSSFRPGFRAFAWGSGAVAGAVRLWTPTFDAAGSLSSLDPALPCATPLDATTSVAGPYQITIPEGATPGGKIVPSPAAASVFGNPARPTVSIRSQAGIVLGAKSKGTPNGGFLFADAIFAYGVVNGAPKLWTPEFRLRSRGLVEKAFVGCTAAPLGTVTLTEHLEPQDDPGRFDLAVDGQVKVAGVGDGGSTGPVPLSDGQHAVGELASAGTILDDYAVQISCLEDTNPASPLTSSGASLGQIPVTSGDDWRCDVTSARADDIDLGSITVGSTPETDHASSKEIGPLGGSVEATSADGTRYSLSIPPDAVDAPTLITLTPTAVSGLEEIADATPAAVEFAPAGLVFSFPARLTITPAPGAPPVDFAASWENDALGIEMGLFSPGPGGSLVVEVPHFSGMASIQSTLASYDNLLTLAIQHLPGLGGLPQQLLTDTLGLPGSSAAVAADVQAIYDGFIKPLIDQAGNGLVELQLASLRLGDFEALIRSLVIENVQMDPGPPPTTVEDLLNDAISDFIGTATTFAASYMTTCNAQVDSLTDWFAIPIAVVSELAIRNVTIPLTFCAFARIETLDWSDQIDETQTAVDGRIRGLIDAPAQTPGGIIQGSRIIFPQPTRFILDAAGATWVAGGSHLDQMTDVSGIVDLHLQRDPGPQGLTVDGTGQPLGLWSELSAIVSDIPATLPVHLAATTDAISVRFRSPPTNVVLPFGQTSHLCVDVYDGNNDVMVGTTVYWASDGPGTLQDYVSLTNSLGIACIDYDHPPGPVTQGDTVTVLANAVNGTDSGSDEVTLVPEWAHIEIESMPDTQTAYSPSTNTAVHVNANEPVHIRVTITESGATPTDPPRRIDGSIGVSAQIESGGGGGLIDPDFPGPPEPMLLLDTVNGQRVFTWDPGSSTQDTTIHISYPDAVFAQMPGVFATVTFTEQGLGNVNATETDQGSCGDHSFWRLNLDLTASRQPDGTIAFPSATGSYSLSAVNYQNAEGICGTHPQFTLTSTGNVTGAFISETESGPFLALTLDVMQTYCDSAGCTTSGPWPSLQAIRVQFVHDASGDIIALDFDQDVTTYVGTTTTTTRATGYISMS